MTRRSKRELERAVDDLGASDGDSVGEWVSSHLERAMAEHGFSFKHTVVDGNGDVVEEPDHDGDLCILESGRVEYYVATSDVPEWIDVEGDLPVRR